MRAPREGGAGRGRPRGLVGHRSFGDPRLGLAKQELRLHAAKPRGLRFTGAGFGDLSHDMARLRQAAMCLGPAVLLALGHGLDRQERGPGEAAELLSTPGEHVEGPAPLSRPILTQAERDGLPRTGIRVVRDRPGDFEEAGKRLSLGSGHEQAGDRNALRDKGVAGGAEPLHHRLAIAPDGLEIAHLEMERGLEVPGEMIGGIELGDLGDGIGGIRPPGRCGRDSERAGSVMADSSAFDGPPGLNTSSSRTTWSRTGTDAG